MQYRKKPVVIEAVPVSDLLYAAGHDWAALPKWVVDAYERGDVIVLSGAVLVKTLEGEMRAQLDDMLICGTRGELYPCKPEPFHDAYEPA